MNLILDRPTDSQTGFYLRKNHFYICTGKHFLVDIHWKPVIFAALASPSCESWPFRKKLSNTPGNFSIWKRQYFFTPTALLPGLERACSWIHSYFIKNSTGGEPWRMKKHPRCLIWGLSPVGIINRSCDIRERRFPSAFCLMHFCYQRFNSRRFSQ